VARKRKPVEPQSGVRTPVASTGLPKPEMNADKHGYEKEKNVEELQGCRVAERTPGLMVRGVGTEWSE
jgi:hypothetical protein